MSWKVVVQMAPLPHSSTRHASMQEPVWQTSLFLQSVCSLHSGTATVVSQRPEDPTKEPSGQVQETVLVGRVSITVQSWSLSQGLLFVHGFWQWPNSKHDCLEGQSPSTRQPSMGEAERKDAGGQQVNLSSMLSIGSRFRPQYTFPSPRRGGGQVQTFLWFTPEQIASSAPQRSALQTGKHLLVEGLHFSSSAQSLSV